MKLPSGAEHRHQGVVIPTLDAAGKVIRLHGTDQNINARKLLERLQNHVAHLSRVEAMNAMATTLAHELNQPLTAAANYLVGSRRRLATAPADRGGHRRRNDAPPSIRSTLPGISFAGFAKWSRTSRRR